ncbi:MAG TPA: hypothetical protein PKZ25_09195, partial [Candidatus Hydrogenedentes bacterium]|nr:hypothetical protein [Candidatus Hydrogenedentota bacterium]
MAVRDSISIIMTALLAVVLASCGGDGSVVEITRTRTVESLPKPPVPNATSAQRFGYEHTAAMPSPPGAAPAVASGASPTAAG